MTDEPLRPTAFPPPVGNILGLMLEYASAVPNENFGMIPARHARETVPVVRVRKQEGGSPMSEDEKKMFYALSQKCPEVATERSAWILSKAFKNRGDDVSILDILDLVLDDRPDHVLQDSKAGLGWALMLPDVKDHPGLSVFAVLVAAGVPSDEAIERIRIFSAALSSTKEPS